MTKNAKLCAAILCLSMLASSAYAAKPGAYVGGGLGASQLDTPEHWKFKDPAKKNMAKESHERIGLSERVFAGVNFNEYLGVEAGAAHYGKANYSVKNKLAPNLYKSKVDWKLNALDLVGKVYMPLGETNLNLYGLGGIAYVHSKVDFDKTKAGVKTSESKTQKKLRPIFGLGGSYDIPQTNLTTNLEYSRIQGTGDVKKSLKAIPSANLITLNLGYNFG